MRSAPYQILHDGTRVSFAGDEFIFVEVGEAMALAKALRIQAITTALAQTDVVGLVDIVPANASYMLRIEPELAEQRQLIGLMAELHQRFADSNAVTLDTEIVEIPVWYDDPWSAETCMRFRDHHQSDTETDIQYTARVNGFSSV